MEDVMAEKWGAIQDDALALLRDLIRIDTQNFEEAGGNETAAVELLKKRFDSAGIPYEVVEPKEGRGNIVARLKGDGSSGKGPLLLSAHLDTVHAPKENWAAEGWKHDPYAADIDEEDGCVYGRGAIDMKHMAAESVALLCYIKKTGIVLSRDLIFAGLADEERSDSAYGVKYLVENRPELIEADIVFNEVGGFSMYIDDTEAFPIQIAEKGSAKLDLTVRGEGGHASVHNLQNPLAKVGMLAHELIHSRLPVRINAVNTASINRIADILPFPKSFVFRRLLSPTFTDLILNHVLTEEQVNLFSPLLRNTATPTIIGGGDKPNQIPQTAWMTLNLRSLPGCTVDDVVGEIKDLIGRQRFESTLDPETGETVAPEVTLEVSSSRGAVSEDLTAPLCTEVLSVISETIARHANGAPILPTMIPGSTDSAYYSQHPTKKPVCLGFTPLRFPKGIQFGKLFHGVNERVPAEGLKWGVRVLGEVVFELCEATFE